MCVYACPKTDVKKVYMRFANFSRGKRFVSMTLME